MPLSKEEKAGQRRSRREDLYKESVRKGACVQIAECNNTLSDAFSVTMRPMTFPDTMCFEKNKHRENKNKRIC